MVEGEKSGAMRPCAGGCLALHFLNVNNQNTKSSMADEEVHRHGPLPKHSVVLASKEGPSSKGWVNNDWNKESTATTNNNTTKPPLAARNGHS
eukprot:5389836-Alexandrium_andersonii.AAC.1